MSSNNLTNIDKKLIIQNNTNHIYLSLINYAQDLRSISRIQAKWNIWNDSNKLQKSITNFAMLLAHFFHRQTNRTRGDLCHY